MQTPTQPGLPLDEHPPMTTNALCRTCRVDTTLIVALVQEGILEPAATRDGEWLFSATSVVRVSRAARLRRDLGVNTAGAVLALELLDEIDALHRRLARAERHARDV